MANAVLYEVSVPDHVVAYRGFRYPIAGREEFVVGAYTKLEAQWKLARLCHVTSRVPPFRPMVAQTARLVRVRERSEP